MSRYAIIATRIQDDLNWFTLTEFLVNTLFYEEYFFINENYKGFIPLPGFGLCL